MLIVIEKSKQRDKKYKVTLYDWKGATSIYIGAAGYNDYTLTATDEDKKNYLARSFKKDSDIYSAGYWARELLWNKRTIEESIEDFQKKVGKYKVIYIKDGNLTIFDKPKVDRL